MRNWLSKSEPDHLRFVATMPKETGMGVYNLLLETGFTVEQPKLVHVSLPSRFIADASRLRNFIMDGALTGLIAASAVVLAAVSAPAPTKDPSSIKFFPTSVTLINDTAIPSQNSSLGSGLGSSVIGKTPLNDLAKDHRSDWRNVSTVLKNNADSKDPIAVIISKSVAATHPATPYPMTTEEFVRNMDYEPAPHATTPAVATDAPQQPAAAPKTSRLDLALGS